MNFFKFLFSKTFLIQLFIAIAIVVVLGFLTTEWLSFTTNHGDKVKVPNLSKLKLDVVDKKLGQLDLRRKILDSANYNPNYPKYSVIEQNPKPGKFVKENRQIYIKLNPAGYPKIPMPNLIRETKRVAEPMLRSLGFEIGDITYKTDIAKDAVLEMWANGKKIEPGDKVMKTTKINLVLGSGPGGVDNL